VLLDGFCERCFWFAKNFPLAQNHPFSSPMPGIVSQVDRYTKRVVNTHLQSNGSLPPWLADALRGSFLGLNFQSLRHINPARWQISLFDDRCLLVGEADAIWEFPDGSWFIADYKTASWTQTQQNLLPLYEAQLNAYAYLAQQKFHKTVVGLALIYFEPEHNIPDASQLIATDRWSDDAWVQMHRCPCAFEADHLGEASVLAGFSNSVLTIAAYRKAKLSRLSSLGELVGRY